MPEIKHLQCEVEFKSFTENGRFVGWASKYSVIDSYGDRVMRGAFTKTLRERPTVPILWQHKSAEVIGTGKLTDSDEGLIIEGQFDMEDPLAVKAYNKLKNGFIKGLSIGFSTVRDAVKDGIRDLTEVKLWEVSVVTFPALDSAQVTDVKHTDEQNARLERIEADIQALKAANVTPNPAPTQAVEPPPTEQEPQILHSMLSDLKKSIPASLFS